MAIGENLLADDAVCSPGSPLTLPQAPDASLAGSLRVLADPTRLRIVQILAANGSVCACDLEPPLGLSQPTVSHHLRQLVQAGIVEREKRGTWAFYRVTPGMIGAIAEDLGAIERA
ncbi:helix-turn-helix transcriptional regulator [Demequina sp. NBRC 110056]|uniref:ArsR/SmtB family transcription factor n=1 Tax=Demequina sp. NBRC 110056 TaxID=1570345 RepID=UPI0009FD81CC|nr:metalloregulator ArsR/SmtB family transcription factor [Demequina sp. NBRC 110056]